MIMELVGKVVRGDNYGKALGFPTANIDRKQWARRKLAIRQGVYAGYVILPNGQQYAAGIVVGPWDRARLPKLEAHLIGFKGNLYGKKLTLQLRKFLRPFKRFPTTTQLQKQIKQDLQQVKQLL